jgi:mevalonate kinase
MPRYRVLVEVSDIDELRRLLFPEEERRKEGVQGVYIITAKSAVTSACRQVLLCRMDIAENILEGTLQELAEALHTAVLEEEENEINRAMKLIQDLADKISTDQLEAIKQCCKWLGIAKCNITCR